MPNPLVWSYQTEYEAILAEATIPPTPDPEEVNPPPWIPPSLETLAALAWAQTLIPMLGYDFEILQGAILNRVIIYRISPICRWSTVAAVLAEVASLRPLTLVKAKNTLYREAVESFAEVITQLRPQNQADVDLIVNRIAQTVQIPNFTIAGMPGFTYPKEVHPPLIKIEAPSSKPLPKNSNDYTSESQQGYSFNTPSKIFGDVTKLGDMKESPLNPIPGWSCSRPSKIKGLKIPEISMSFEIPNPKIPNVSVGLGIPSVVIAIPPCIAQHIPPMFLPRNSINSISLGLGKELARVQNGVVALNNFGTKLSDLPKKIYPLVNKAQSILKDKTDLANGVISKVNERASQITSKLDGITTNIPTNIGNILNKGSVSIQVPEQDLKEKLSLSKLIGQATTIPERAPTTGSAIVLGPDGVALKGETPQSVKRSSPNGISSAKILEILKEIQEGVAKASSAVQGLKKQPWKLSEW